MVGDFAGTCLRPNQSQPGFCASTKTWLRLIWSQRGPRSVADFSATSPGPIGDLVATSAIGENCQSRRGRRAVAVYVWLGFKVWHHHQVFLQFNWSLSELQSMVADLCHFVISFCRCEIMTIFVFSLSSFRREITTQRQNYAKWRNKWGANSHREIFCSLFILRLFVIFGEKAK